MTLFAIMSVGPNPALEQAIKAAYPGQKHYAFSPTAWVVSDVGTAQSVSEKIGVMKGGAFSGVLVMTGTGGYFGFASTALWEWMKARIEEGAVD